MNITVNSTAGAGAAGDGNNSAQPVSGINIFWIIFVLAITSAWHPLGSSVGFPSKIRRYIRLFPLTALLDTFLLYAEFIIAFLDGRDQHRPLRHAARGTALRRLRNGALLDENLVDGVDDDASVADGLPDGAGATINDSNVGWLTTIVLFIGLDVRARLLSNALVVLVYAKILGYYGTPFSLAIATIQFASWVGNEVFLLLTYGFFVAQNVRQLTAAVDEQEATNTTVLPSLPKALFKISRALWFAQAAALVGVGIWAAVSKFPSSSTPSSDTSGFWDTYWHIADVVLTKLATPLEWYLNWTGPAFDFASGLLSGNILIAIISVPLSFTILIVIVELEMLFFIPVMFIGLFLIFAPVWVPIVTLSLLVKLSDLSWQGLPSVLYARIGSAVVLGGLLVYYIVLWDPTGTSKAPWTENLG